MPDEERVRKYLDIFDELKTIRRPWEKLWKEIIPYVNPRRSFFDNDTAYADDGSAVGEDIGDDHAINAADTLVRGLVGYNVGPRIRWFQLKHSIPEFNDLPYVADWFAACDEVCYKIFSNSNFYASSMEYTSDLVTVGTPTMVVEDPIEFMTLVYDTRHPKETYILSGRNRSIDLSVRRVWMKGRTVLERYSESELTKDLRENCEEEPLGSHEILHIVHPQRDKYFEGMGSKNRPWIGVEILAEDEEILREAGYYENPVIVARWQTNSDEDYGRSPALNSKSSIRKVNEIGRTLTEAGQLAVEKPLNIPDYMRGKEQIVPHGRNYYKRDNRKIEAIDLGGEYPIGLDVLNRWYESIDKHFHTELFEMLTRSERQMTAREINERMGEKVALLAGPLTGMNNEFLKPVVKRTFHIALRNGWLPVPPMVLLQTGGQIDVDFIGPLAQAQQRYHQAHNINSGLSVISAVGEIKPEVWDNIDLDELIRKIATSEGFPEEAIREIPERDKLRAARARAIQQQRMLEQAGQVADAYPKLNEPVQPNSPVDLMTTQGRL